MLLPHDEFVFAKLKRDGADQTLRLVFVTHEILVSGQSLRRIETAMQRMELSLLTKLPGSQRSLIADGQPVILEIVVTETMKAGIADCKQLKPNKDVDLHNSSKTRPTLLTFSMALATLPQSLYCILPGKRADKANG